MQIPCIKTDGSKGQNENKAEICLLFGLKIRGYFVLILMTETLPSEGRIEMVTSRTGMKKAEGEGTPLYGLQGDVPLDRVWVLNSLS